MALVKHPVVVQFEKETGCAGVTRLGFPFELVEDDNLPHPLVSSNVYERASGASMKVHRGAPLGAAELAATVDAVTAERAKAETAAAAAEQAKLDTIAAKVG